MRKHIPKRERVLQAVEAAKEALTCKRPGTANSDVNTYALPVEVPAWVLHILIAQVEAQQP